MIPMEISPETYADFFPPAPDYLLVERTLKNYEFIGRIAVPKNIQEASVRFVTVGKILAVSPWSSEDEYVERLKDIYRTSKYICFSFHVSADVSLMPQFKFKDGVSLAIIHVKDGIQVPNKLDLLLTKQADFEKKEMEKEEYREIEKALGMQNSKPKLITL